MMPMVDFLYTLMGNGELPGWSCRKKWVIYTFYTGNHNPEELGEDLWKMWQWVAFNLSKVIYLYLIFCFSLRIYILEEIHFHKITFKKETVLALLVNGKTEDDYNSFDSIHSTS